MTSEPLETFVHSSSVRFRCKFPECGKDYASTDGVRKHCRKEHKEWLSSLGLGSVMLYAQEVHRVGAAPERAGILEYAHSGSRGSADPLGERTMLSGGDTRGAVATTRVPTPSRRTMTLAADAYAKALHADDFGDDESSHDGAVRASKKARTSSMMPSESSALPSAAAEPSYR